MNKRRWMQAHWKMGVHLLLRTKRFGVNNSWWNNWDSMFGYPLWKILLRIALIYPLVLEYRFIKRRCTRVFFLPADINDMLWPSRLEFGKVAE